MGNEFKESIRMAVNNPNLTGALGKFSEAYKVNRVKAYEGIDFEALRGRIAEIKADASSRFDELSDQFQQNAEACGATVFRTNDPAKVREYILKVARDNNVKTVVKSKSMATEEIHLNRHLEQAGINVGETGSIVLMTNEGNARLVTSLPKIHIALVGIEKLIEKFADVATILKALPRSATAQLLTSYVSIITGPTPNSDGSMKDLHIILMDNRRSEMAADPKFKQALQCIRCASCLNVCPVYRLVGGHVFGKVYTGGIGTILTAWFG